MWSTRFGLIWGDDELSTAGKLGRTALAASFTALAAAVTVALWRRWRHGTATGLTRMLVLLAAWTTVVWLVRGTGILVDDHDFGFKAVHTVLAVVSIALAGLAWREATNTATAPAGVNVDPGGDDAGQTVARST